MDNLQKAILTRHADTSKQTTGELVIVDSDFKAKTIERAWLENQKMISSIPKGEYLCKWQLMNRVNTHHYCITGVPNRDGVFIHGANYAIELHGCIALGSEFKDINGDGLCDIVNSRRMIADFEAQFRDENGLQKDFYLLIL